MSWEDVKHWYVEPEEPNEEPMNNPPAPGKPGPLPPREMREKHRKNATDLFHLWARCPEYEPLPEDLVLTLVNRIEGLQETLWKEHEHLVREARASAFEEAAKMYRKEHPTTYLDSKFNALAKAARKDDAKGGGGEA